MKLTWASRMRCVEDEGAGEIRSLYGYGRGEGAKGHVINRRRLQGELSELSDSDSLAQILPTCRAD